LSANDDFLSLFALANFGSPLNRRAKRGRSCCPKNRSNFCINIFFIRFLVVLKVFASGCSRRDLCKAFLQGECQKAKSDKKRLTAGAEMPMESQERREN